MTTPQSPSPSPQSQSQTAEAVVPRRTRILILQLVFHVLCLSVYTIPLLTHPYRNNDANRVAVLDESHIMSDSNKDVNGDDVSVKTIFTNDYWGRPMNSPSSHKSWRPLTVLSFRWFTAKGNSVARQLLLHRLVNVVTHAVVAELVAQLATRLMTGFLVHAGTRPQHVQNYLVVLHLITKALFVVHPTHVEVTANAANRPHLLGALCAALLCFPRLPWMLFLLAMVSGYLTSETFLFTLPPIVVTMTLLVVSRRLVALAERRQKQNSKQEDNDDNQLDMFEDLFKPVLTTILPRCFLLFVSALAYYGGRYAMDSLSIPEGLIRPAENPFYRLQGWTRVRSYTYVLGIHIAKAFGMDFVGFSHEYGHACILPITEWDDARFTGTVAVACALAVALSVLVYKTYATKPVVPVLVVLQLSWLVTLFPVSGLIKVGTFVSDRIVVASTVSVCMIYGIVLTTLIFGPQQPVPAKQHKPNKQSKQPQPVSKSWSKRNILIALIILAFQWRVIHKRTLEWMDWIPLLHSSLKTCPRFAKAHLELSKISNGLYPEQFNLTKSRWHLKQAEEIDPDFCDVNHQFAQIAFQENSILEFEERLSDAILCTYTTGGAVDLWQRYWKLTLDPQQNTNPQLLQLANERYKKYMVKIQAAIDRAAEEEEQAKLQKKSPFVWDQQ